MVSKIGAMLLRSLQEQAQPTAGWAWPPALSGRRTAGKETRRGTRQPSIWKKKMPRRLTILLLILLAVAVLGLVLGYFAEAGH
jgi:hypothetical protein